MGGSKFFADKKHCGSISKELLQEIAIEVLSLGYNYDVNLDLLAHEYGWTIEYIENLTCSRFKRLLKAIEGRQKREEYITRVHAGIQAMATIQALGYAFEKKEFTVEDLIGKFSDSEENKPVSVDVGTVEEWKEDAKKAGLKTGKN